LVFCGSWFLVASCSLRGLIGRGFGDFSGQVATLFRAILVSGLVTVVPLWWLVTCLLLLLIVFRASWFSIFVIQQWILLRLVRAVFGVRVPYVLLLLGFRRGSRPPLLFLFPWLFVALGLSGADSFLSSGPSCSFGLARGSFLSCSCFLSRESFLPSNLSVVLMILVGRFSLPGFCPY
jgi:hypothetical protein